MMSFSNLWLRVAISIKKIYTALTLFFHMCKRYFLNQVFACIKSLLFFNSLRTVNPSENFR